MLSLSFLLILVLPFVFVTTSSIPLVDKNNRILITSENYWLSLRDETCNGPCLTLANDTCKINDGSCYIGKECYEANQTSLNGSFSCLQCEPNKSQTQWSVNPTCLCTNPLLYANNICPLNISEAFYIDPENAVIQFYNFLECGQDRKLCQPGFFLPKDAKEPIACCPGFFCPEGQTCMIPCRPGSYCPSPLTPTDGTYRTEVKCPLQKPKEFDMYGCGGSSFEGFCPSQSYCPTSANSISCPNDTHYCPTGVEKALPCPTHFVCIEGRARRTRLITSVLIAVIAIVVIYILLVIISQKLILEKKILGEYELENPKSVSDYFKKRPKSSTQKNSEIQLNIHLYRARLRNVTRFDVELNPGFTGQITAGRLTALMGGSGCGKSSLLETIHGRRRLRENGHITFANHEPLSNDLTDYIGYVPQEDIMHKDLTVFETVYYSARTRRLDDSKDTIINDVCFVLQKLGLRHMHNSMTRTLSGGQRKRVNVAMEIAACPKVLLLDEPTSGLDTVSCDDLFQLLQLIKYSLAGPVTIIMVIHQPSHELYQKIDDIFFLTPLCCLAYQGARADAKNYLQRKLFASSDTERPPERRNDCDTCFIMLTKAEKHIDNHTIDYETTKQELKIVSQRKRGLLPFFYVMARSIRQVYVRGATAEGAYIIAYFLLGACLGYLFENKQQGTCDIKILPTIYFLISLAFGILTCISSQRLFGVEKIDKTYERESRNYFHPFQYWLAKSLVDIVRMILYPLVFLSMLYIEVVPRGPFSYYLGVMILLSFVCSGVGQLTSVLFSRTEYAYLAGTIVALLSCLLSGFSPTKFELGGAGFITTLSFSRHIQHLFFRHETDLYVQTNSTTPQIWSTSVEILKKYYSYSESEIPYFWLIFIGLILRAFTFYFLYSQSEYRSERRFRVTHLGATLKELLRCRPCRR